MNFWFVNLGKYYNEQRNGSFLWAPIINKKGKTEPSWESVAFINKGDVIFCNKKGYIVSVALAQSCAYKCNIPDEFEQSWRPEGRKVDLTFIDINNPLRFKDYKEYISKNINREENPFDINGNAKMGYLFALDEKIAKYLINKINNKKVNDLIVVSDNEVKEEEEEFKEEREQFEKINNGSIVSYTKEELEIINKKKYKYIPTYNSGKKKIVREKTDPKLKATRLEIANYLCEIDHNHDTFLNSSEEHQYMECHHIIPMNAQKDFENQRLDSLYNLISLCPICHSQVHYASHEKKLEIFNKMYKIRKNEMLDNGFDISTITEIFNKYYK